MASTAASSEEQFPISRCTPEDIPEMQTVWDEAFAPNPLHYLSFPKTILSTDLNNWYFKRATGQMARPEIRVFKITDTSTGKIAGFMRWQFPHPKPVPKKEGEAEAEEEKQPYPPGTNIPLCDAKFGALDVWRDKFVDVESTYVAMLLCTSPKYQRRGIGSRLLKHVLDVADAEGKKAYIEATEDGYPLYRKMGFEDLDMIEKDLSMYGAPTTRSWAMMREPVVSSV